jgi:hypothetical protein
VIFLTVLGAALLVAALYALYGRPSSHIRRKRKQEIRNGFRLFGNLLLGFITMLLVFIGTIGVTGGGTGRLGKVSAFLAYAAGIAVLYVTAERWKTWIAGFFGIPGLWNSWIMLSSRHTLSWPYKPVSIVNGLLMVGFCVALIMLAFPTSNWRKPFDLVNHICLVTGVLAFWFVIDERFHYFPLVISLAFFGFIRLRLAFARERRERPVPDQPPSLA